MPHRSIVILVALFFAVGVPMVYKILKDRAAESLRALLAGRFVLRPSPLAQITIPSGGHVLFHSAYIDTLGSGFVLILGNRVWTFSKGGAYQCVAGLFKPGGDAAWAERVRKLKGIIVAAAVEGGALVLWKGLPSGESILAHIEAVSTGEEKAQSSADSVPPPSVAVPAVKEKGPPSRESALPHPEAAQTNTPKDTPTTKTLLPANPRDAYFLGYLPSVVGKTVVNYSLIDEVEAHATDDKLKHACEFGRKANKVNEIDMRSSFDSLVKLGNEHGFAVPPIPSGNEYKSWAQEVLHAGRIAAGSEGAAFEAGAAAGDVHFAMWIARNLIYLRTSAPGNAILTKRVEETSVKLDEAAAWLSTVLDRFGKRSPDESNEIRTLLGKRPKISTLVTPQGMQAHFSWANELEKHLQALGQALAATIEAQITGPPTGEEETLLQEIIAHPEDDAPRLHYAQLAALRKDPRAELIQWQMVLRKLRRMGATALGKSIAMTTAAHIVQAHPEWSDPVLRLGAQTASFRRGFVDEITIDAAKFLVRAPDLYTIAPILHVHFTGAKGKIAELVASPHITRLRSINLRENGLTDDDVEALSVSSNLARLRWLSLTLNKITIRGVEALAMSSSLGSLVYVELALNLCDDPTPRFVETEGLGSFWESTPAGIALEKKVGHKVEWLHQNFSSWPADLETV